MRPFLTLTRRELAGYFVSLTGYLTIAAIQFLVGLGMLLLLEALNGQPFDMPLTEAFYNNLWFFLILLLAPPVVTMRTFAHEKFSGTYETLMTAPVSDTAVVMAKFTGALLFFLSAWAPVMAYPLILRHFAVDLAAVDWGALGGTFIGILLFGSLYTSIGCCMSSITRSQIIAAMNAFVIGLGLFLASYLSHVVAQQPGWEMDVFRHISLIDHMRDFTRGIIDVRQVVFYLSLTVFFLFLTTKSVESRRWR
ncbi:MAG: ABC transporter permease subunit [Verrucomicrobiae bacterium]|jgi:ABC-2 type transport system permease protein|nr:ABC transporter permease subunit [Verrucomicrobiae bacterium]